MARQPSSRRGVTKPPVLHPSREAAPTPAHDPPLSANVVARAAAGDHDALETLLLEAQAIAWRFSRTVCGHPEDAEDTMQDALVQTYRHIGRLREPAAFRPWLYRTVRNACLMSRRRRVDEPRRMLSLDELLPSPDGPALEPRGSGRTPEQVVVNRGLRRRLDAALATLPAGFRAVVFLREMEGLSTRETATVLGLSEDNVKARLHRARLALQRELAGWRQPAADTPRHGRQGRTR